MKKVIRFQTQDGILHDSERAAHRHASREFQRALTHLAKKLAEAGGYENLVEVIHARLNDFSRLAELKADLELERDWETETEAEQE